MTTIATDGHSMAGDRLIVAGNGMVGLTDKIHRLPDGRVFGCCGPSADIAMFGKWMRQEIERPELSDDFSALVLTPEGKVFYLCRKLEPVEFVVPQAIGSGSEYAIGAMLAGAKPGESVSIAAQRDTTTGGGVTVVYSGGTVVMKEAA